MRRQLAILALFVGLAVLHTWPLATAPARYWRDTGDYHLNTWALAWIAYQLPRDPSALFHANIFHPERWTLAFSEHLMPQAAFAAPAIWLGGPPHLGYNISLLAGFALTGWAMAFVIGRWTGSISAGVLAGCVAAFNGRNLTSLAHIQAFHQMYLPLALLALDRLLATPRWRHAFTTGAWLAMQALTSSYWVVFTAVSAVAATIVRVPEWWPWRRGAGEHGRLRLLGLLAAAAVTAALLLSPVLYPYWQVKEAHNFRRDLAAPASYSARLANYLVGSSRLHLAVAEKLGVRPNRNSPFLFPGFTALALVGVTLATGVFWRDRRARMLTAIAGVGIVLSLGSTTPVYRWLYEIGLLQYMRVSSRFGMPALMAVAGLAGFGLAFVLQWRSLARSTGARLAIALAAVVLVNVEALRAPIKWDRSFPAPRVYRVVASLPDAVIAEVPFPPPGRRFHNAVYLPAATVHWKPMVNGYSGFLPGSYRRLWSAGMNGFPSRRSLDALRAVGVTHIVLHRNRFRPAVRDRVIARLERTGSVELVVRDGDILVYELRPASAAGEGR